MIKEILFGNKVRSILKSADKILKKMVSSPRQDIKDIYKTTADMIVGVSGKIFTPENIEAAVKAYVMYQSQKQPDEDSIGLSFSKKF